MRGTPPTPAHPLATPATPHHSRRGLLLRGPWQAHLPGSRHSPDDCSVFPSTRPEFCRSLGGPEGFLMEVVPQPQQVQYSQEAAT